MSTTIITNQSWRFSERVQHIPKSFIREILKITAQPDVISFAGGLPNPASFPVEAIKQSTIKVLDADGRSVMQYAPSEGYLPLRKWIAKRYAKKGMNIKVDEILITNGSQQGLDLTSKIFINERDNILVEQPSYLGAIQAFSAYRPQFISVPLLKDGVDTDELKRLIKKTNAKFFYAIPNFQNPTGLSYSNDKKRIVADIINDSDTLLLEDDPYGEIKFNEIENHPIKKRIGEKGILLGSFSKIISPGMRLGWIVAAPEIIEKLLVVKQAADLHSNFLSQRVIYQYIQDYNIDDHIETIIDIYKAQKEHMIACLKTYMPAEVKYTNPDGGMFIWMTLPPNISAYTFLELATKQKVVFVPGEVFYTDTKFTNTLRLNYSNSNFEEIERGISILGRILKTLV
jgi:2-aminoadipate transaminase